MIEPIYRKATQSDLPQITRLLNESDLPLEGVEDIADGFLLAFRNGELTACAALEGYGSTALLRSVAVCRSERGAGLGQEVVRRLLDEGYADGFKTVVLLTSTAARFFPRFGFREINRSDAPPEVQSSVEFRSACPQSATVMLLDLSRPLARE